MTDMGFKDTVTFKGKQCKYILTAVDVFKCFVFLRLLKGKSKRTVQQTWTTTCSNGTEFKGAVKILKKYFIIKIICSSAYHLHSKVKIEIDNTPSDRETKYNLMQSVGHGVIR